MFIDIDQNYKHLQIAHEISHNLGEQDNTSGWMSDNSRNRQVHPDEVQQFLDPAIQLANEFESQTVTIHFFAGTGADGKPNAKENTYRVYDGKKYVKSITVQAPQGPGASQSSTGGKEDGK
jgi:hypothetical protein